MALKLITAPAVEPLSLAEVKSHLRLDSGSLADPDVTITPEDKAAYEAELVNVFVGVTADG